MVAPRPIRTARDGIGASSRARHCTAGPVRSARSACGPPRSAPSPSVIRRTTSTPGSTNASTWEREASRPPTRSPPRRRTGSGGTPTGRAGSCTCTCGTPTRRTGRRRRSASRSRRTRYPPGSPRRCARSTGACPVPTRLRRWPASARGPCGTGGRASPSRRPTWSRSDGSSTGTTRESSTPTTSSVNWSPSSTTSVRSAKRRS